MGKIFVFLAICVIAAAAGVMAAQAEQTRVVSKAEKAAARAKAAYKVNMSSLDDIQELVDQNSAIDTSVSVIDLQTGQKYHYGDTSSYTAASIGKLITATLYLHQTELGMASLDEQVGGGGSAANQLEKLIVESDNTAWHNLNNRLTSDALQTYAASQGLGSYNSSTNIVSSDDIALLLYKLARGELLNNEHTNLLLSLMQQADMRHYIVAGAPDGAATYHKVGYLSDRLHDAAIVKKADRSYVLVIFSKTTGSYSFSRGANLFIDITGRVSKAFFGSTSTP